jgi:hypothetical protein
MSLDLSALVLGPNMDVWAKPVTVTPIKSQPGQSAYSAQGIWTQSDIDVLLDGGERLASSTLTLGIKLDDFAAAGAGVWPAVGDQISVLRSDIPGLAAGVTGSANFVIDVVRPDGQGGAKLTLKALTPVNAP